MKYKMLALTLSAVAVLSASALSVYAATADNVDPQTAAQGSEQTEKHGKKEKIQPPENAIDKDAAKEAALQDAGLTAEQADKVKTRVSATEDGTVVYKVRFTANDKWYSYKIDALTGEVIDRTEQSAEEHAAEKENARAKKGEGTNAAGSEAFSGRKHRKGMKPDAETDAEQPTRSHNKNNDPTSDTAEQSAPSVAEQSNKSI